MDSMQSQGAASPELPEAFALRSVDVDFWADDETPVVMPDVMYQPWPQGDAAYMTEEIKSCSMLGRRQLQDEESATWAPWQARGAAAPLLDPLFFGSYPQTQGCVIAADGDGRPSPRPAPRAASEVQGPQVGRLRHLARPSPAPSEEAEKHQVADKAAEPTAGVGPSALDVGVPIGDPFGEEPLPAAGAPAAAPLPTCGACSEASELTDAPSRGSVFHHLGRCTPCKFNRARRGCKDGYECNLCHLPHPELTYSAMRRVMKEHSQAKKSTQVRCERVASDSLFEH